MPGFGRAPAEEPKGLVLRGDAIAPEQELELLECLQALRWEQIVIRGQAARRTARHRCFPQ